MALCLIVFVKYFEYIVSIKTLRIELNQTFTEKKFPQTLTSVIKSYFSICYAIQCNISLYQY